MNTNKKWVGLAVLALPTLLVSIDVFVMLLALPHIGEALDASANQQLWIMDIYGFLLAGFLITMGTLGDRIGRRRLLLLGAAGFAAASVLGAFAPTAGTLIAARALLGVAGATIAPSSLSLITTMFTDAKQRGLAVGIWFACFLGGAAAGPVVGGFLLGRFWWGSVFLLGVPVMLVLMVLGPIFLPEYRAPGARRLDLVSVALSLGTILPVIYGIKELARDPRPLPALALIAGAGVGLLFVRRQRRLDDPLLDLRLFGNRSFSVALGGMFFGTMLMGALMLFYTEYLQLVAGLSALDAGFWMLPMTATNILSVLGAPLLARRIPAAYLISGGLAVSAVGLLLVTTVGVHSGPAPLIVAWALTNLGAGPFITLGTSMVISAAPAERAGSAAAINETGGEFGFALGIALLGTLGTAIYRAHLPADAPAQVRDSLTGAAQVAGPELLDTARSAFVSGLHVCAGLSALVLAVVAVTVLTVLRPVRAAEQSGSADGSTPELVKG
ncbi:MFS transporter [Hamadaea tsunoensis]|uniref:MFS transporter n=1 Tax=Hamadaea tsunoensis TaxID=53368 RepID=UPI0004046999|nr:MFS transporter [Hamadaea tsunoensis]